MGICSKLALHMAWCAVPLAWANEAPATASNVWVNVGGISTHFNRDRNYNENNVGAGVEIQLQPDLAWIAGAFSNSVHRTTAYTGVNWQPYTLGEWKLGAAIGVMNGYPGTANGGVFFAALPIATLEGKQFGINVGFIPSVGTLDGALAVQFKFRIR